MTLSADTVVFDLDGTIYQDTEFHRIYLKYLVQKTPYETWEKDLAAFADDVFAGKRLIMNSFYRIADGRFSCPGDFFNMLESSLAEKEEDKTVNLGDAWAVMEYIGRSLGLLENGRRQRVYAQTRLAMAQRGLKTDHRLHEALERLKERCYTVLMSNSYESTAREFLRSIGFEGAFSSEVFSAGKPQRMKEALAGVRPGALQNPRSLITIGDFAYNDLEPLGRLGAVTVWMNPYPCVHKPPCDLELQTTADLAEFLEMLKSYTEKGGRK